MPAETIPVANPRFLVANQAEPRAMAGTKAAPLPSPVRRRMANAKPNDCVAPDDSHGQIADKISGAQQAQLGVVKLEPVFHGRQDDGVGHAAKPMGGNCGQKPHENDDPAVVEFGFRFHSLPPLRKLFVFYLDFPFN